MIDNVLVPIDGSPLAWRALEFALESHPQADITLLYVVEAFEGSYAGELLLGDEELRTRTMSRAAEIFGTARELTGGHQGEIRAITGFGNPPRVISDHATEHDIDLIVLGSHGRTLVSRVLLGDVALRVLQQAPVPVTVVR